MVSIESEIEKLQHEITSLKISTRQSIEGIENRISRLRNNKLSATPVKTVLRHSTGHKDRTGKDIYIGDTVKFVTSGKYDSSQGTVSGYSKTRVLSTDYKNREIPRAPHNLIIVDRSA